MDLRHHLRLMARYHGWAYERLYASLAAIEDHDYRRNTGLFFGSIHATLNHLLLADRIWYGRLTQVPYPFASLRDPVDDDRESLGTHLRARGDVWVDHLDRIDDATLGGITHYRKTDGSPGALPCASILLHVFNHGTHHRGQISTVLTQLGVAAPEMDLPYLLFALDPKELAA